MYLEIDEGFPAHRKTLRYCALMADTEAWSRLIRLWTWACRSCPSGDLRGMSSAELEIAMGWQRMDGKCYAAAAAAGFVDEEAPGAPRSIHDWMHYTGGAIVQMETEAARKKRFRNHMKATCGGITKGCDLCQKGAKPGEAPDIRRTTVGRSDTDKTSPVQSSPVQTGDPERARVAGGVPESASVRCTGHDLVRWYGAERAQVVHGAVEFHTPRVAGGKASTFADGLDAAAIADVRPSMREHFLELVAGKGCSKPDEALADPTYGYACWESAFTRLREKLRKVSVPKASAYKVLG